MAIKAVIYDIGSVLVDTANPEGRSKWEAKKGLKPGELIKQLIDWRPGQNPKTSKDFYPTMWDLLKDLIGLEDEEIPEMRVDFFKDSTENLTLQNYSLELKQRGYRIGILSNAWPGARQEFLRVYKFDEWVDKIVFSGDYNLWKSDPASFKKILEELELAPEEAIFVDDTEKHVLAAQKLGMKGIKFPLPPDTSCWGTPWLEQETRGVIAQIEELLQDNS